MINARVVFLDVHFDIEDGEGRIRSVPSILSRVVGLHNVIWRLRFF